MKRAFARGLTLGLVSCAIVACGGATASDLFDSVDGGLSLNVDAGDSGKVGDGAVGPDSSAQKDAANAVDSSPPVVDSSTPDTGPVGTPCTVVTSPAGTSTDCPTGYGCFAPNCVTGTCQKVQTAQTDYIPVCGCDTINYWNAGTAVDFIAAIKGTGKCASPLQCTGAAGSATCDALGTSSCEFVGTGAVCLSPASGTCWGLPTTCPTTTQGVTECTVGSNNACVSLCDAITNQDVYRTGSTCKTN